MEPRGGFAPSPERMSITRFLLLFVLGFVLLPVCDGLFLLQDRQEGRALAVGIALLVLAIPAALLLQLARPFLARLLPKQRRASDALPLAAGLVCALVPQIAPLLPGQSLGGRLAFHPVFAPLSTLAGVIVGIAVLGRLLPNLPFRNRGLLVLVSALWVGVAATFGVLDARVQARVTAMQCAPAGSASAPHEPDVTVIVLDTLRAGGVLGAWRDQELMPSIHTATSAGRDHPRAYSGSNCTPPGHSSLFTGRYPAETGTLSKGHVRLPAEVLTLAEYLRMFGYTTLGVVSNTRLDSGLGFAQGFEQWDDGLVVDPSGHYYALRRVANSSLVRAVGGKRLMMRLKALADATSSANQHEVTAMMTSERVGAVLDQELGSGTRTAPVHLFVNYIDPHMPYDTRADLAQAFLPNVEDATMEAARHDMPKLLGLLYDLAKRLEAGEQPSGSADLAEKLDWVEEAYWEQCRQTDEGLRALFGHLQRHGLLDPEDLVLITSDHGEELGENAQFGHGNALFEESVRVPFLLLGGGFESGQDQRLVSLTDFFPTVLVAMGVDEAAWPRLLSGFPLQGRIPDDRMLRFESGQLRGCLAGHLKMIALDHGDRLEWTHAFDLSVDPLENHNLMLQDPLPEQVRRFLDRPPITPSSDAVLTIESGSDIDLAALGYADEVNKPR